jgi:hypothetical protein
MELGETFSEAVTAALPDACHLVEETILHLLRDPEPIQPVF